jgi:transcriptional regulator
MFSEAESSLLFQVIEQYSFGTMVCSLSDRLEVAHLPFVLDRGAGKHGTLLGHVARANPLWKAFDGTQPALVIFQGPHGYVSPSWYASRQSVPTWNYAVVHAVGRPKLADDEELVGILNQLVRNNEDGLPDSWSPSELEPAAYEKLRMEIAGFKMEIQEITGKFKLGQNRTRQDRKGAIDGLRKRGGLLDLQLAEYMAAALERG